MIYGGCQVYLCFMVMTTALIEMGKIDLAYYSILKNDVYKDTKQIQLLQIEYSQYIDQLPTADV